MILWSVAHLSLFINVRDSCEGLIIHEFFFYGIQNGRILNKLCIKAVKRTNYIFNIDKRNWISLINIDKRTTFIERVIKWQLFHAVVVSCQQQKKMNIIVKFVNVLLSNTPSSNDFFNQFYFIHKFKITHRKIPVSESFF